MPRPLWSGSLSFGLVNVPVRLVSAARDLDLHFRQLRAEANTPIEVKRFCSKEDVEVPWDEIARCFEFDDGDTVMVTDGELDGLEPERTRTIEIDGFVELADVDPMYFDHPYLLVPAGDDDGVLRAYRLLMEVMKGTERAALGRFVMRTKEYRAIVRERGGALSLTTLRMHDEVRDPSGIDAGGKGKAPKKQLDAALRLIEAMTVEWDPERYEDQYRKRLQAVVREKRKGGTITAPEQVDEPTPVPDLMEALRESLEAARGGGGSKGAKRSSRKGDDLADLSRDELYERAQAQEVPGRSSMSKDELIEALS
jgi:DNA end-binding protein Ku